jgi:hypothetical protein
MNSKYLQMIAHGLVLVALMLALIAAALWLRAEPMESRAQAQTQPPSAGIPDTAKQRQDQIVQLQEINKHLIDIEKGLRDGSYSVTALETKEAAKRRADAAKE